MSVSPTALTTLHEKAIYLHEARQFQVEKFDYEGRKAYVRQVDCDYFTDAIDYTQVKVLEEFDGRPMSLARAAHGDVRVNRQVVGWKKIKFFTLENVGAGHLSMPEQEMHTTSFWLHFPDTFLAQFPDLTPTRKAKRAERPGQCDAHGRVAAADVRSARPRSHPDRGSGRRRLSTQPVPLRCVPGRSGAEPTPVPAGGQTSGRHIRVDPQLPL